MVERSKQGLTTEDLDEIIDGLTPHSRASQAWDTWPEEACSFIRRVCERKDAGTAAVSMEVTLLELEQRWKISVSARTLQRYVRFVLGRKSWRQKE